MALALTVAASTSTLRVTAVLSIALSGWAKWLLGPGVPTSRLLARRVRGDGEVCEACEGREAYELYAV